MTSTYKQKQNVKEKQVLKKQILGYLRGEYWRCWNVRMESSFIIFFLHQQLENVNNNQLFSKTSKYKLTTYLLYLNKRIHYTLKKQTITISVNIIRRNTNNKHNIS